VSDTPRTDAAYVASTGVGIYELFKESQDIERELNAANERIKELEEQILKAQKQKEIAAKLIDQIFREGPKNHAAEVLLNQYFWELV